MNELQQEIREKTVGYITAALGLVAGLAWNDAIKSLIEHYFPAEANTLIPKFIYAIVITIGVVVVGNYLLKIFSSKKEGRTNEKQ